MLHHSRVSKVERSPPWTTPYPQLVAPGSGLGPSIALGAVP